MEHTMSPASPGALAGHAPPDPGSAATGSAVITDPRRQRLVLIAMCTALVAVVGSVSGLNVAQQAMAADLGASQSTLLWIINGYTVALAALLLPLGAIGDRWGRKWLLVGGLVLFSAANLVAAMAASASVVLVARIVAGAGAALIMPVTLSTITSSFPADRKAQAIGIWTGFAGAGGIIGLFASSLIVDELTWPWVFALPIALSAIALVLTVASVGNSKEDHAGRFDIGGSVLSALAIGGLVLGIHEGPEKGWTDPLTVAGIVVGVVALLAFVAWERRQEHPLLDVRVFADRSLAAGSVTLVVVFGIMFGLFLVLLQYLQAVLGYSALRSASGLLPMAVMLMGLSSVAPRLAGRFGNRQMLVAGLGTFTAGLVVLAMMASADGGYWSVLPGLVIIGAGLGLSMTPGTTAITGALPEERQGVASALNDTVRELGGALGVALLGSMLNSGYRSGVSDLAGTLPEGAYEPVREGIGRALAVAGDPATPPDVARDVLATAGEAFVDGWRTSMWFGVALAAGALLYVLLRGPGPEADPGGEVLLVDGSADGPEAAVDADGAPALVPAPA
ncbi:MAG TPA: DHA2 family efflux MFS transporter permease subunit [Aquihabitans sp.]|nr:DHA2 family efflux MFS transporter permease subunit [Aquihabitans sp.]